MLFIYDTLFFKDRIYTQFEYEESLIFYFINSILSYLCARVN